MRTLPRFALAAALAACTTSDDAAPAPSDTDEHVLAEFERPTDDGLAHYVFRFVEDDGAIATLVGTPMGYPAPVDDPCALDTFLKVAPDDAIVPFELRRACGDVADPSPRRVADLRTPALTFAVKPLTASAETGPFCTSADYTARFNKIKTAAKTQATTVALNPVCDAQAYRDTVHHTCAVSDPNTGNSLGLCDYDQVTAECGNANPCCLQMHLEPQVILNPACAHDVVSWSSPLTWLDWEGDTNYGASKFQAEVSACTPNTTTVIYWMKKNSVNEPWGPLHQTVVNGAYWWVLKLDSGTTNGAYRGARYLVHANGSGVRPAYAAAMMQGIDRAACPLPFPT